MPEATPLSPALSHGVSALARSLVAAARNWTLYPRAHPAVQASLDRLRGAIREAASGAAISLDVTPDALVVCGMAIDTRGPVADAAAWLHHRDVRHLTFAWDVLLPELEAFLALLVQDPSAVRRAGGPGKAWHATGYRSIVIEQIDFAEILRDRDVRNPARGQDDPWRAIVRAVTDRRKTLDGAVQRRLLEIAGDVLAIADLAQEVMAPSVSADGSPMLTSQAAAVVAAYRHLVGIVDLLEPARRTEVMQNLAAATATLDPHVIMQILSGPDEAGASGGADIKRSLADAFDDVKVAQLLATTLAIDGTASDRLANVFDTIAPDEPRKRRVLTLARSLLNETSFGRTGQFQALWTSTEELLLRYNERPFVSASYGTGLDAVGGRAESMATTDVPPDLVALIDTLNQDNVRRLSVVLLIDLLGLERDPARAPEVARDVAALAEDLLLAGDYDSALMVTRALAEQTSDPSRVTSASSRVALDALASTAAFRETVELVGDMTDAEAQRFSAICASVGPAATDALRTLLDVEAMTTGRRRATAIICGYGGAAVARLEELTTSPHWYARANGAALLGAIASGEAVPLLQPLLRSQDPRVMEAGVRALSCIHDLAAARAVHTALRSASGERRRAMIAALVAERDPRVVPLLVRILHESDVFGPDHTIVLQTIGAIGEMGRDDAVADVAQVMRKKRWFARRKARGLKQASLDALQRIGTPAAQQALAEAAACGDRLLRRMARAVPGPTHG
jgi:HEAT repeat protein